MVCCAWDFRKTALLLAWDVVKENGMFQYPQLSVESFYDWICWADIFSRFCSLRHFLNKITSAVSFSNMIIYSFFLFYIFVNSLSEKIRHLKSIFKKTYIRLIMKILAARLLLLSSVLAMLSDWMILNKNYSINTLSWKVAFEIFTGSNCETLKSVKRYYQHIQWWLQIVRHEIT